MDWDRLRVFYVAAEAGSFTHAGDQLSLSQSAVSRQVSALERDLKAPLFHRHARGLILTEQGELLYRAAKEMVQKLDATRARLHDSREQPNGDLKVTTTLGLGTHWLTPRLSEFAQQYPDIRIDVILTNEELDLAMREADVALRLRQPTQPDLIQRRLFTVHFHAYASQDYIKSYGRPENLEALDDHKIIAFGGTEPNYLAQINWLPTLGRDARDARQAVLTVNSVTALKIAVEKSMGIAVLPDYLVDQPSNLVQVLQFAEMPALESYLVYPSEMKNVARVQVFRDFLVSKAQRWTY
ncbi:MAG: LysR family transcriptional regulator [Rhizobiales bacterium 65-9]|nr:MAG: LysR family transcriptional regulator [Rhizobiales bacterium 65-9]